MSVRDVSGRGSVRQGCVWLGKCPSGMCLVGEVSVRDVSDQGNVHLGCVWLGKCPSGKSPSGKCLLGMCLFREVSVGGCLVREMFVRDVSGRRSVCQGCVWSEKCLSGKCPSGKSPSGKCPSGMCPGIKTDPTGQQPSISMCHGKIC